MSEPKKDTNENESSEKKSINFDDAKEPIDSIEKTVEDLKRKIQELSDENENENNAETSAETKDKINEIKDNAANVINKGINDIKSKANEAVKSEDLQKTIEYVKANAVKAVDGAKAKINDLKNDPNVQASYNKAADAISKAVDTAKTKSQEAYDHLDDTTKANIQNVYDKASKAVSDSAKAVDEFVNRPDVQEKINEVKTTTVDLAQKGADAVKNLFDSNKNEK